MCLSTGGLPPSWLIYLCAFSTGGLPPSWFNLVCFSTGGLPPSWFNLVRLPLGVYLPAGSILCASSTGGLSTSWRKNKVSQGNPQRSNAPQQSPQRRPEDDRMDIDTVKHRAPAVAPAQPLSGGADMNAALTAIQTDIQNQGASSRPVRNARRQLAGPIQWTV